jgi:hypothetical protein
MKCPICGNEVGPEEAFCGQCGTPIIPNRPIQPTEPVPPQNSLLRSYNTNNNTNLPPGMQPPSYNTVPYSTGMQPPANNLMPPNQPLTRPVGPRHQGDFYQDATEAMPSFPASSAQNYPAGYPQQSFPAQGGYPGAGQYGQPAPFQSGNFAGTSYPAPFAPPAQGYGASPRATPPPPKQQNNAILVVACVCLVIAILTVSAFGALYFLRGRSAPKVDVTPTVAPAATVGTTPTPAVTDTPVETPTTAPSPTADPTPLADPGFTWCDTTCTTNGFIIEIPNGWQKTSTADNTGTKFTHPTQSDEFAAIKLPASPGGASASDLVTNDLNANYANQPGYVPPTSTETTTIGAENWVYQIATYTFNGQKERIAVYATIHMNKGYIIELEALDSLYTTANTQYFEKMTGSFRFLQ